MSWLGNWLSGGPITVVVAQGDTVEETCDSEAVTAPSAVAIAEPDSDAHAVASSAAEGET